jgi:hypothetical protein
MAYYNDWGRSAQWVNGALMRDVMRRKSPATRVTLTLDGTGTEQENIAILAEVQKSSPQVRAVAWFSAYYWQPAQIERIAAIHRAARKAADVARRQDEAR